MYVRFTLRRKTYDFSASESRDVVLVSYKTRWTMGSLSSSRYVTLKTDWNKIKPVVKLLTSKLSKYGKVDKEVTLWRLCLNTGQVTGYHIFVVCPKPAAADETNRQNWIPPPFKSSPTRLRSTAMELRTPSVFDYVSTLRFVALRAASHSGSLFS